MNCSIWCLFDTDYSILYRYMPGSQNIENCTNVVEVVLFESEVSDWDSFDHVPDVLVLVGLSEESLKLALKLFHPKWGIAFVCCKSKNEVMLSATSVVILRSNMCTFEFPKSVKCIMVDQHSLHCALGKTIYGDQIILPQDISIDSFNKHLLGQFLSAFGSVIFLDRVVDAKLLDLTKSITGSVTFNGCSSFLEDNIKQASKLRWREVSFVNHFEEQIQYDCILSNCSALRSIRFYKCKLSLELLQFLATQWPNVELSLTYCVSDWTVHGSMPDSTRPV